MDETFGTSYPLWYYLLNAAIIITTLTVLFFVLRGVFRFALKNKDKAGAMATKAAAATIEATRNAVEAVRSNADTTTGHLDRVERTEAAYAQAATEIESNAQQRGLWAKAFADADGNEQKQKALYIRYRAAQIARDA